MIIYVVASLVAGSLCGLLGYYVNELKLTTLSFSVAHAALVGATMGMVLGVDTVFTAISLAIVYALIMGLLIPRVSRYGDVLSMAFFSFFNALALFMIYLSQTVVLATVQVGGILWGSLLAITPLRVALLIIALSAFTMYTLLAKDQLDSMLFDLKLAEAEGVNVYMHTALILLFVGTATALTLAVTGGFLVFSLLYNPVITATQLSIKANVRRVLTPVIGALSATVGLGISYYLDLPVGATIALTSVVMLAASTAARLIVSRVLTRKVVKSLD